MENCNEFLQDLYSEEKATQVAAYFLLKSEERDMTVTKLRLVKWMYLSERLSYKKFAEPIIGDCLVSMKHGPVLSNTLYLMENPDRAHINSGHWIRNVETDNKHKHTYMFLSKECKYVSVEDLDYLSVSEIKILDEIWLQYSRCSALELESLLHDPEKFPEWKWKDGDSNNPIYLAELFPTLGYDQATSANALDHIGCVQSMGHALKELEFA